MTNIFIKILKNIFLLIMSILKTLSSNYVPLLLVCVAIFYFLDFLAQRKLILPCNACDNGSWYYKCRKRTGYGTRTCRQYTLVTETTYDFINLINKGSERYIKAILMLIQHTSRVLKKFVTFIDNLFGILSLLFPPWLIFRYLVHPVTKELYKGIAKATEKLNLFSCAFTIPIINKKIDICNLIITGILLLLDFVILIFNTLMSIFGLIGKLLAKFVKKYIIDQLLSLINKAMKFISKNIMFLLIESVQVLNEITKPLNVIFDIPVYQYLILIVNVIFDFILDTIPGLRLLKNAVSIILGFIILALVITILMPIIGGFIALFPLTKSLIYFIFGLDDDNDFKFLFQFAFKLINKIKEFIYG